MAVPRTCPPAPRSGRVIPASVAAVLALCLAAPLQAQPCPEEAPLQTFSGGGQVVCPCFVAGEEAGVILNAPADHYPIEITKVGIGWASQFGGTGQTLEQSIHVYGAGLPNPGARLYTLDGPILFDGAINEFDLAAQLGTVTVNGGPFTVTLEFANSNAGNFFAPSVIHDGNGCTAGKNLIKANPGGWLELCSQGLSGDWVMYVKYRRANCGPTGIGDEYVLATRPAMLLPPNPNPMRARAGIEFVLAEEGIARLAVFDVSGREVAVLADRAFPAGANRVEWDASSAGVTSGLYFVRLEHRGAVEARKVVVSR